MLATEELGGSETWVFDPLSLRLCTRRGAPLVRLARKDGSVVLAAFVEEDWWCWTMARARRRDGEGRQGGSEVIEAEGERQAAAALLLQASKVLCMLSRRRHNWATLSGESPRSHFARNPTDALLSVLSGGQISRSASPRTTPSPTTAKPASSLSSGGQNRRSSACEGRGWDSMTSGRLR